MVRTSDREITPEVSREKEWKFRKALITLTTVPQIHESIRGISDEKLLQHVFF
jgi:hypothetical protein